MDREGAKFLFALNSTISGGELAGVSAWQARARSFYWAYNWIRPKVRIYHGISSNGSIPVRRLASSSSRRREISIPTPIRFISASSFTPRTPASSSRKSPGMYIHTYIRLDSFSLSRFLLALSSFRCIIVYFKRPAPQAQPVILIYRASVYSPSPRGKNL